MIDTNSIIDGFQNCLFVFQPLSLFLATGLPIIILAIISKDFLNMGRFLSIYHYNIIVYTRFIQPR